MSLKLPQALWAEIEARAVRAYPEECCGALIGPAPEDFGRPGRAVSAAELRPLDNAWERPARGTRYRAEPAQLARLEKELLGTGRGIIGYYHSHPDVPDWPSPTDLLHAWPCYSYLIVSVVKGKADGARSWVRSEDGREFSNEPLTIE